MPTQGKPTFVIYQNINHILITTPDREEEAIKEWFDGKKPDPEDGDYDRDEVYDSSLEVKSLARVYWGA